MDAVRTRKRFGQHFLRDREVLARLMAVIHPRPGQCVVEIGPGTGVLTRPLLLALGELHAVEIDARLAEALSRDLGACGRLVVHALDALRFPFRSLVEEGRRLRIVGNLPYNISTPLLFHLLSESHCIEDMVFMLQHEVAGRITAPPGTRRYGRLSVMVQYHCDTDLIFEVPPTAFDPPPKVSSSVLRLAPRQAPFPVADKTLFEDLVRKAFSLRRKTLRNALKGWADESVLASAGIDPGSRAETLTPSDYARLSNAVAVTRSGPL
ncbi:MAG: 16S rRNA (adenine(1518)-N(6)/adenine(1519)-N(6))-dimethyltransferase RsmA [Gammaproteobacteria bacterium]